MRAAYLGRVLAVRSILGIGAAAPAAFGAVLDLSAPGRGWGPAFVLMGIGGVVATVCAALLPAASSLRGEHSGTCHGRGWREARRDTAPDQG